MFCFVCVVYQQEIMIFSMMETSHFRWTGFVVHKKWTPFNQHTIILYLYSLLLPLQDNNAQGNPLLGRAMLMFRQNSTTGDAQAVMNQFNGFLLCEIIQAF
jgi:hypothetical protein